MEFETGRATLVLEEDFDPDVFDAFGLDDPGDDRGNGVIVAVGARSPRRWTRFVNGAPLKPFGWNRLTSTGGDEWPS